MKIKKALKVFLILILIYNLFLFCSIYYYSRIEKILKADAIVVLGASQWNGQPSPVFKARLDHAYDLYSGLYADKLILTGGIGKGENLSEAEVGKRYLVSKGVKKEAILMEEKGWTSWQSLNNVKDIIKDQYVESFILVSDGFHLMRLNKMGNDLGWKVTTSPTPDSPILRNKWTEFRYMLRELGVYWMYLFFKV
ncbi:MAG: hypothetical protein G01um101418_256 [Parcubacteria group bacterium Gr01-1014_18]|nr:MAG: hypothetical protein Greene041636_223 [Parcubacteria group bacterium Greene0416_36]TSC81274.1 MAG: hypothetical protein G01um101418_256 [Parcubacteria group bacterium Gr01-1014_18]TSC99296.1 MAG: hypothetical protein Greene101420_224 [Parcubacteria group bacterium Greene1014_20]TSD06867.1 MAG: hypothetical protein Greene07142_601 [Parcubacteria group bacterium Greene0714_2]